MKPRSSSSSYFFLFSFDIASEESVGDIFSWFGGYGEWGISYGCLIDWGFVRICVVCDGFDGCERGLYRYGCGMLMFGEVVVSSSSG